MRTGTRKTLLTVFLMLSLLVIHGLTAVSPVLARQPDGSGKLAPSAPMTVTADSNGKKPDDNKDDTDADEPVLRLSSSSEVLYVGGKTGRDTIRLQTNLDEDEDVTFTSSKPRVATVSKDGKVTAVKRGATVIRATATVNGKVLKASCRIEVRKATLYAFPKEVTLTVGKTQALRVKAEPKGKVRFKSSLDIVAYVNSDGVIKARERGRVEIIVSCNGLEIYVPVKILY